MSDDIRGYIGYTGPEDSEISGLVSALKTTRIDISDEELTGRIRKAMFAELNILAASSTWDSELPGLYAEYSNRGYPMDHDLLAAIFGILGQSYPIMLTDPLRVVIQDITKRKADYIDRIIQSGVLSGETRRVLEYMSR